MGIGTSYLLIGILRHHSEVCSTFNYLYLEGTAFITHPIMLWNDLCTNEKESLHAICVTTITKYKDCFLLTDSELNNVRLMSSNNESILNITRPGAQGNDCGLAAEASFGRARGLCVEFDHTIYVTDSRCGTVKILSTINGTAEYYYC